RAPLLLPDPLPVELSPEAGSVRAALEGSGALFFRQVVDHVGSTNDAEVLLALWELVWAGIATNDTLAPLRALTEGAGRRRAPAGGRHRPGYLSRMGPPTAAGRWSLLPHGRADSTRRLHAAHLLRGWRRDPPRGRRTRAGHSRRRPREADGGAGGRRGHLRLPARSGSYRVGLPPFDEGPPPEGLTLCPRETQFSSPP